MDMQSRWLICGYKKSAQRWTPISSLPPQLTPSLFYEEIEPLRRHFDHFGVYVLNGEWNSKGTVVPKEEVRSIDEIFIDDSQVKSPSDLIEGMTFFSRKDASKTVTVLTQKMGWVMIVDRGVNSVPTLVQWESLLSDYSLTSVFRPK